MNQPKIKPVGSSIFLILLVCILCIQVESVRFELKSGATKCIADDIKANYMTVGKYYIVSPFPEHPLPDSHKLTVRVTSAYGNSFHYLDHVLGGNFAFQAAESGDYMTCFFAADHKPPVTLTVDFEWKSGVTTKDWLGIAKKGSIESMEFELHKMFDATQSIHDEIFYLRSREEEMQELNKATNSKMFWLSWLSLCVCISVAGLQLWHLKSFFGKKKLI